MRVVIEFCIARYKIPNIFIAGVENMSSVLVHGDAIFFFVIAIAPDVRARFENLYFMPLLFK